MCHQHVPRQLFPIFYVFTCLEMRPDRVQNNYIWSDRQEMVSRAETYTNVSSKEIIKRGLGGNMCSINHFCRIRGKKCTSWWNVLGC